MPCAEIRDYRGVLADPQFAHRAIFAPIPAPGKPDSTVQVVAAGHIANVDGPQVQRPPPRLGEHTDEVLAECGFSPQQIGAWHAEGVL